MSSAGPYTRAFVVGAIWFGAVALKMVSRHDGPWYTLSRFKVVTLLFALVITALLVGLLATKLPKLCSWWATGLATVIGCFVTMGLMLATINLLYKPVGLPEFKTTDELMAYSATEAAKWIKHDRQIDMDYSIESVEVIEQELGWIANEINRTNPPPGTFGMAMGYGGYIGEVLRRREGGTWAADHPVGGSRSYPLTLQSNQVVFPVMWCWKRLINGEEDNVYLKLKLFDSAGDLDSVVTNQANSVPLSEAVTNAAAK